MSRSQVRCLRETNDCVCTSLGKNSSVWCTRSRHPINLGDDTLRVNNLLAISGHFITGIWFERIFGVPREDVVEIWPHVGSRSLACSTGQHHIPQVGQFGFLSFGQISCAAEKSSFTGDCCGEAIGFYGSGAALFSFQGCVNLGLKVESKVDGMGGLQG